MTATELLALAAVHGVRVSARDGNLVCDGRQSQITALLPAIKAHKPELLAALPDKAGPVDSLPLGAAKLAVLPGGRVLKQGVFVGGQEVRRS